MYLYSDVCRALYHKEGRNVEHLAREIKEEKTTLQIEVYCTLLH